MRLKQLKSQKSIMKKLLLSKILLIFLIFGNKAFSQIDTSFWFAAPFVSPDNTPRHPIVLQISALSSAATVKVRQPSAIAPNKYDTTFVVPANTTFNYVFWRDALANLTNLGFDSLETRPSNTIVPYGLYISSSSNIQAVYNLTNFTNLESFSLKGQNALGTSFMCPFQTNRYNLTLTNLANTPPGIIQPKQQINIVASKPNTIVWITPKCNTIGNTANITYSIVLNNPGDAYTIENAVQSTSVAINNLSGTEIISNKPIAVTVADDSVKSTSGCYDLIGDQLVPIDVNAFDHIFVKGGLFGPEPEGAYVVATQNNTQITVNDGVTTTTVINKGDTYFYKATQDLTYINANKKISCLQLTGIGCEYSSDLLPSINCAGSNFVSFSRTMPQTLNLFLICKNGSQSTFTLSNAAATVTIPITGPNFTVAPGTATLPGGPYYGARIALSVPAFPVGSYTIGNNTSEFQMSLLEGGSTSGTMYHYNTSFSNGVNSVVTNTLINSICMPTKTVALSASFFGPAITNTWTVASGTGTFSPYVVTPNTIATTYTLSNADTLLPSIKFYFTSIGSCNSKSDSVTIQIYQQPQITTVSNFSINNTVPSITLSGTVTNAISGIWSGGNGGAFAGSGPITTYTPIAADFSIGSATFALASQSVLPGCLNASKTISVTFFTPPVINAIANPPQICAGQNATMNAIGAISYTWTPSIPVNGIVSPLVNTTYTVVGVGANTSTNTSVVTLSVDLCTGILNTNKFEGTFNVYPNPSKNVFNFEIKDNTHETFTLEIYDVIGQMILEQKIISENTKIDLSKYANGIYYFKFNANSKQEVYKVIKE